MRIALVYAPYHNKLFNENLTTVDDEFGKYTPLNLLYLASILRKDGHDVQVVDAYAENLSKDEALERVAEFDPTLIGFSLHAVVNFYDTLDWIRHFKKHLPVPNLVGGTCFSGYPDECMTHKEIDFGIIGTALGTVPHFLHEFRNGRRFHEVPGLCYREGGEARINRVPKAKEPVHHLPMPARDLIRNEKYYQYISKRRNFTIMMTMMGCPFRCNFCPIPSKPFNIRTVESVLAEIDDCYHQHGIREIDFFDAILPISGRRMRKICEGLIRRGYDLVWSCRSRVDNVNGELLHLMARAGCVRIYYGIEAADASTLDSIKKDISLDRVRETIRLTNEAGIKPLGFFIIGNPGETKERARNTMRLAKSLNLEYAQFSLMTAKMDTPLYDELIEHIGYDYWREYIRGTVEEQVLPRPWTELAHEEVVALTKEAYIRFYLTPGHVLRILHKVCSFDELQRYVKAGVKMLVLAR